MTQHIQTMSLAARLQEERRALDQKQQELADLRRVAQEAAATAVSAAPEQHEQPQAQQLDAPLPTAPNKTVEAASPQPSKSVTKGSWHDVVLSAMTTFSASKRAAAGDNNDNAQVPPTPPPQPPSVPPPATPLAPDDDPPPTPQSSLQQQPMMSPPREVSHSESGQPRTPGSGTSTTTIMVEGRRLVTRNRRDFVAVGSDPRCYSSGGGGPGGSAYASPPAVSVDKMASLEVPSPGQGWGLDCTEIYLTAAPAGHEMLMTVSPFLQAAGAVGQVRYVIIR